MVAGRHAGSPMSPIAPARTKSTSLRRTAWARSSRSPAVTKDSCTIRCGRRIAKSWPGRIKSCGCGTSTSPTKSRCRSTAGYGEIQNYSWSPDSKWLAYDKPVEQLPVGGEPVLGRRAEDHAGDHRHDQQLRSRYSIRMASICTSSPTATSTKSWETSILNSPIRKLPACTS